jgi:hypothetical protein
MTRGAVLVLEYFSTQMAESTNFMETRGEAMKRIMDIDDGEMNEIVSALRITSQSMTDAILTSMAFGFWLGQKKLVQDAVNKTI